MSYDNGGRMSRLGGLVGAGAGGGAAADFVYKSRWPNWARSVSIAMVGGRFCVGTKWIKISKHPMNDPKIGDAHQTP